ncbi:hemolysin family protein [Auritidibacter ignavus]|uniref:hemolysin family protein n=1 Tax=Auritidibacter ignavus TaxID=678932 RepID=UPI00244D0D53|nr:hemolysin family protein [Auritidibacter ignavus]WGH84026.1 hemolysin family protein [Auritidibacter ignavus]WGH90974.1 hemolysin family protein [Auritidibacter ignavus]
MEWLLFGLGLLLIGGNGFFVSVEFSMISLDVPTVQRMVDNGNRKAIPLLKCLKSLSTQLSSCQLGITLTTLLTGYVMEPALGTILETPMQALGLPDAISSSVSLVISMVIATILSMLMGELVPKNLSIAKALDVGITVARAQLIFTAIFKPVILLLNGFANRVLKTLGLEAEEEISGARTPEELSSLVRRSAEMGTLDGDTALFVDRTLRFADRTAADVMTPRMRVETVEVDQSLLEVIDAARRTGVSRFPVIEDSADTIRGVLHVKKAIAVPKDQRGDMVAADIMTDLARVPETMHLDSLLTELRAVSLQMVVVVDEYGGTAGIVTLEDLVEEIVGEVSDEHDKIRPGVLQTASGHWFFPALLRPDELVAQIPELKVPENGAYETVGGFIMAALGRVPDIGDQVTLDDGTVEVIKMDGRRVDRLKYIPALPDTSKTKTRTSMSGAPSVEAGES